MPSPCQSSTHIFAVPTSGLLRCDVRPTDAIGHAEARGRAHRGARVFALHYLAHLLALPAAFAVRAPRDGALYAPSLGVAEQRVAIAVDAVREVQELIVKPLPQPIAGMCNTSPAPAPGRGRNRFGALCGTGVCHQSAHGAAAGMAQRLRRRRRRHSRLLPRRLRDPGCR